MAYYPEEDVARLTLDSYAIVPESSDATKASSALGMIDRALCADYKQGSTTETLPSSARSYLLSRGKAILSACGIQYIDGNSGVIITAHSI